MEGKCSAACAAWFAEACHQMSNLSFVFCGSKPSSEATPYDIKYPLLSSGHPVRRVFSLKFISTKFILKLKEIGDLTLGREGTALASGALVFFGCWSKAIGSILRTSDQPSRNIDRVISGHLRSWVSQLRPVLSCMDHKYGAGCVYPRKAMCDLILGKDGRPDPWMMDQGFDGHFLSNAMLFRHGGTEPWPWPTEPWPWPVQEVIVLGHRPD
ncbi:hypothetical protein F2Q68_00016166 [Brassica cretica]|uniref:Uncharacterized protein n=1 Tax=Brassica cretica TaxID=69181 RepID=A0A8S9HGC2_BRACR|nr:hypothetical protein F2Q68_00016166 [Brassica cretica]